MKFVYKVSSRTENHRGEATVTLEESPIRDNVQPPILVCLTKAEFDAIQIGDFFVLELRKQP